MSQVILTTIYNKLIADVSGGTVYALVSGKIYQLEGPQGAVMPLLVYAISNDAVDAHARLCFHLLFQA